MKKSCTKYIVGSVGAILVLSSVVWFCQRVTSPTALRANSSNPAPSNSKSGDSNWQASDSNKADLNGSEFASEFSDEYRPKNIAQQNNPVSANQPAGNNSAENSELQRMTATRSSKNLPETTFRLESDSSEQENIRPTSLSLSEPISEEMSENSSESLFADYPPADHSSADILSADKDIPNENIPVESGNSVPPSFSSADASSDNLIPSDFNSNDRFNANLNENSNANTENNSTENSEKISDAEPFSSPDFSNQLESLPMPSNLSSDASFSDSGPNSAPSNLNRTNSDSLTLNSSNSDTPSNSLNLTELPSDSNADSSRLFGSNNSVSNNSDSNSFNQNNSEQLENSSDRNFSETEPEVLPFSDQPIVVGKEDARPPQNQLSLEPLSSEESSDNYTDNFAENPSDSSSDHFLSNSSDNQPGNFFDNSDKNSDNSANNLSGNFSEPRLANRAPQTMTPQGLSAEETSRENQILNPSVSGEISGEPLSGQTRASSSGSSLGNLSSDNSRSGGMRAGYADFASSSNGLSNGMPNKTGVSEKNKGLTGNGLPGNQELEGPQTAQIYVEKIVPDEIQVGREETFTIILRNTGKIRAKRILLTDSIPAGTVLVSTSPSIEPTQDGILVWSGFDMAPSEERQFEFTVIPQREGDVGSVAQVSFATEASVKTRCTKPVLKLDVSAPSEVLIGEKVRLDIVISNTGTGTASGVILNERVPDGFRHPDGTELDNRIGDLKPGETKHLPLEVESISAGKVTNYLSVKADSNLFVEKKTEVFVHAPDMKLAIEGSKLRYLEKNAVYTLKVWNSGTASASNVDLAAEIPTSFEFISADKNGVYDEETHTVHWGLVQLPENLPEDQAAEIQLVVRPVRAGNCELVFDGVGENQAKARTTQEISVEGMSALSFEVVSLSDPVEVNHEGTYEIRVSNRGTKASENIKVCLEYPEQMQFVSAQGPTQFKNGDCVVKFDTLASLAPKEEKVFKVKTNCLVPGDHRIRATVSSDDLEPLSKEESTRVYSDQ